MALFQRLFFAVIIAGLISGAAMAALQQWRVVPLIIGAEAYEGVEAPAEHTHDDAAGGAAHTHSHEGNEWMPADGFERTFYTVVTGMFAALGFAFVLSAASVLTGFKVTARNGVLWGLAGFAVFQLAPAFGLPPELPGMPAADVVARQIWWWGTALATATAIFGIAKFQNLGAVAIGIVLILMPHVIGAPPPAEHASAVPAPLAAAFAANTLFTGLAFWLVLGPLYGLLVARLAKAPAGAVVTA